MSDPSGPAPVFSLVRGDPLFRLQRALKLVTDERLFVVRRAIFFALLTWAPIAIWVLFLGDEAGRHGGESIMRHFGVYTRCLIAIPLLVLAEARAERMLERVASQFTASGLVPESERAAFDRVIESTTRLRDAWWVWLPIAGLVIASVVAGIVQPRLVQEVLCTTAGDSVPGFGAWWFFLVARPLGATLGLAWLWRVVITALLLRRLAGLKLNLIPSHPDRAAGLGFVEQAMVAFSPVVLAISATASAHEAHFVLQHGVAVQSLKLQAAGLLIVLLAVFLSPLFAVAPALRTFRRRAYFDYGSLVGRVDAEFDRRWIQDRNASAQEVLDRSDFSSLADAATVFATASKIRAVPISRESILAILIPALIPMLIVVSIQVPVKDILVKLARAVM